jgi:hypothetical protein
MLRRITTLRLLCLVTGCIGLRGTSDLFAVSARFKAAAQARIEKSYAVVVFTDGTKAMVPLASLPDEDREYLTQLSNDKPLAHGKSQVVVAKEEVKAKQTIQVTTTVNGLETVQLCPPNVPRDQLGATCMVYARVHWLDIAGYSVDIGTLYKIINAADPKQPWKNEAYHRAMYDMVENNKPKPVLHSLPGEAEPFEWARAELRKGHPLLAAFPKEIWQALPANFVAQRPWSGGDVGHQIVINGFTWNPTTKKGTFHIINSWNELPEFDLTTDNAQGGALVIEQSLSPRGEIQAQREKELVKSITLLRALGKTNMYEVETNLGHRKIAAATEDAARALIENAE